MATRGSGSFAVTMPKRQALNQLTQENWDEQEEREIPGTFKKLPEENLSNRIIKQARRRSVNLGNTMQSSSPFASFKGFGNKVESRTSENGDLNPSQHGNGNVLMKQSSQPKSQDSGQQKNDTCRDMEYYRLLKCLNESLVSWVTQHLTKNPLCDFTPVFSDYKRHLEELEMKFSVREEDDSIAGDNLKEKSSAASLSQPSKPFASLIPTEKSESFGTTSKITSENNTANSSGATLFGNLSSKESVLPTQNKSSSSLFSVSKSVVAASNTAVATTGFQFGNITNCSSSKSSVNTNLGADCGKAESNKPTVPVVSNATTVENKPFSFSSSIVQSSERKEDLGEESEENTEPPKNEFTPVVEKDAVYSKRCKLFYNKDGNYVEKGIGTLYLKPFKERMQLVVRADTSLGLILLNILLTTTIPVKRVGKNNVLIVCIPNPPIDPTKQEDKEAVPMLIRVKTEDDANELLKQIEESKTS